MKEKFIKFMEGRYGVDGFARFTMGVALVCIVASVFFRNGSTTGAILNTVGLAAIIYTYFSYAFQKHSETLCGKSEVSFHDSKNQTVVQKRKKYDGTEKNTSYLYLSQLRTENQDPQGKRKN